MLTKVERILLENTLDALDRLFDRESKVLDLYALLFATGKAFGENRIGLVIESPIHELKKIIQSKGLEDSNRESALRITDDLRKFVASELSSDAAENPKQRHSL